MTLYIKYLSDNPVYLLCSYHASALLGKECLGLLVWPDKYLLDHEAYAVGDEILGDRLMEKTPLNGWAPDKRDEGGENKARFATPLEQLKVFKECFMEAAEDPTSWEHAFLNGIGEVILSGFKLIKDYGGDVRDRT